jgi:large subunit ribosomal protein L28
MFMPEALREAWHRCLTTLFSVRTSVAKDSVNRSKPHLQNDETKCFHQEQPLFHPFFASFAAMKPSIRPLLSNWPPKFHLSPFQLQSRSFCFSPSLHAKNRPTPSSNPKFRSKNRPVPPYPYGPARWFKRQNKGLFGGQTVQFGNNVSSKTKTKTRRKWLPNIQRKRLWSDALNQSVQVKVTTRVLRTIDKCGGLDEYVLGEKAARIKELGMLGWSLRWRVMRTNWYDKRMKEEVAKMNLPPEVASRLLAGMIEGKGKARKTATTQQLGEQTEEADEQLEESDKGLSEEALVIADEAVLEPNERESVAKEEPEKEAEEERILFMAEQSPSSQPRASS